MKIAQLLKLEVRRLMEYFEVIYGVAYGRKFVDMMGHKMNIGKLSSGIDVDN